MVQSSFSDGVLLKVGFTGVLLFALASLRPQRGSLASNFGWAL